MRYYIVLRNRETNTFELQNSNDETFYFTDLDKVILSYISQVESEGLKNVKLLQEVELDISFKVKPV